jgi:flagellar FliL protein
MAKAPPKTEDTASNNANPAPKKKGKLLLIVVILLLVLLIVVAGGIGALLLLKNKDKDGGEGAHAAVSPASTVDLSKPPTFVPLDAFTVNLQRDEGEHYLQVVLALRVSEAAVGESLKAFMPEVRHRINLLLSSKLPSEVSTTAGREELAAGIRAQVNEALGFPAAAPGAAPLGPVQAVLFSSFIIQ